MSVRRWTRNISFKLTVFAALIIVFLVMTNTSKNRHQGLVKCVRQGHNAVIYDLENNEYVCYDIEVFK